MNETEGTAIEVRNKAGEVVKFDYGQYAGMGSLNLPTTGRVNFLSITQSNAKSLLKGHEKFNPDARAGSFMFGDTCIDGEKGVYFVGIEKEHVLCELTKLDGTGDRVGEHDPNGEIAKKARATYGTQKKNWRSEKGNFLVDSIRLYGVLFASKADLDAFKPMGPAVVDFQRTKMAAWEKFISPFNKIADNGRPPLFAAKTHLSIALENRQGHDYYNIRLKWAEGDDFLASLIKPEGEKWKEWAEGCRAVANGIKSGALKGDDSRGEDDGGAGPDAPF